MITYKIELKASFDTEDQEKAVRAAIRQAARQVLTMASLVAPQGRPPDIAIIGDHFFEGREQIELFSDEDEQS